MRDSKPLLLIDKLANALELPVAKGGSRMIRAFAEECQRPLGSVLPDQMSRL
ncbi:MAG: hypothetical protein ABIO78_01985 [Thermoanaerobaculia bacterium]